MGSRQLTRSSAAIPTNVTIGGTSAGGASVGLAAGLARQAPASTIAPIVQSAYPTTKWTTHAEFLSGAAMPWRLRSAVWTWTRPRYWPACAAKTQSRSPARPAGREPSRSSHRAGSIFWEPVVDSLVIPDQPRDIITQRPVQAVFRTMVGREPRRRVRSCARRFHHAQLPGRSIAGTVPDLD